MLLGRRDVDGQLRFVGRSTVLSRHASQTLAKELTPAAAEHPWTGWSFSAGWGSKEKLRVALVEPQLVAKLAADVSLDPSGKWRDPVRWLRVRSDVSPADAPLFGSGNQPAAG
ncbi:hypothetical protein G3I60_30165 [Streptomyces sp. SID13666]|uniref:hypothetical protein n=1 Tax=unclassified Streptomyces TaxID=2593676 RepID=UPI0013BFF94F|nr:MULTISPECIES: hypothetical protein [unclassified Streptomyces]NEA58307.1 hypothetical protein [Streptomyces sp. SID13666]NEA76565.1 hypothetical protein [Streptomyces sp. SID13588]